MFAEGFPRNSKGWIDFGTDKSDWALRKKIFPPEVGKHPAKANLFMIQAWISYVTKPGDLILDPFSGTGSIMIAALQDRRVMCIDCSPGYVELLNRSAENIIAVKPDVDIMVLEGDCQKLLPLPVDHICFSPPYAAIMKKAASSEKDITADLYGVDIEEFQRYSAGTGNVGMLPEFFYYQSMEVVFKLCYQSLQFGGTMTFITKDHMENRRRFRLTKRLINSCLRLGFIQQDAFKHDCSEKGSPYTRIYRSQGLETVDDEDIVIMGRE